MNRCSSTGKTKAVMAMPRFERSDKVILNNSFFKVILSNVKKALHKTNAQTAISDSGNF
jgi:hypothetical protein